MLEFRHGDHRTDAATEAGRDEAMLGRAPGGRDERCRAPPEDEHAGIDGRRWHECVSWETPCDARLVMRTPRHSFEAARPGTPCIWATAHSTIEVCPQRGGLVRRRAAHAGARSCDGTADSQPRETARPGEQRVRRRPRRPRRCPTGSRDQRRAAGRARSRARVALHARKRGGQPTCSGPEVDDDVVRADSGVRDSSAVRAVVRRKCWLRAEDGRAPDARRPATEEAGRGTHRCGILRTRAAPGASPWPDLTRSDSASGATVIARPAVRVGQLREPPEHQRPVAELPGGDVLSTTSRRERA